MSLTQPSLQGLERVRLPVRGRGNRPPGEDGAGKAESRIAEIVHTFNDDVEFALKRLADQVRQSQRYLIPNVSEREQGGLPPLAQAILERYTVVDTLAIFYRDKTRKTFILLIWLAFAAMFLLEGFTHLVFHVVPMEGYRPFFLVYPAIWLAAFLIWLWAHEWEYQRKYQDYRALAEALRVQFFWKLLGLPDKVENHYLQKQKGELEWILDAIRQWRSEDEQSAGKAAVSGQAVRPQKALVRECWVQGQITYFEAAAPREETKANNCRLWGKWLFWLSLPMAMLLWVFVLPALKQSALRLLGEDGYDIAEGALIFITGMLMVGAALWLAYGEKMAFSEHSRQYQAMCILFQKFDQSLTEGDLTADEAKRFRDLGTEALAENGDWLLLHRDRPLEVIVP